MCNFIKKKWYVLLISIALMLLMGIMSPLLAYILMEITNKTLLSYLLSYAIGGIVVCLPVISSLAKQKHARLCLRIVWAVLLILGIVMILLYI